MQSQYTVQIAQMTEAYSFVCSCLNESVTAILLSMFVILRKNTMKSVGHS